MKNLNNPYIISFAGLKNGEHIFKFHICNSFFQERDYSEIKKANIIAHVTLLKEPDVFIFTFKLEGTINVFCDRCGDDFDMPVWGEQKLIANMTNDVYEEGDDIISISSADSEIDISHFLYEYIFLLLPVRRVHPDKENGTSTCNSESLKIINKFLKNKKQIDHRWDALKKIK
ncbi:MAG: DUF177 domain-containing protein [Bacteroidota bacterium]